MTKYISKTLATGDQLILAFVHEALKDCGFLEVGPELKVLVEGYKRERARIQQTRPGTKFNYNLSPESLAEAIALLCKMQMLRWFPPIPKYREAGCLEITEAGERATLHGANSIVRLLTPYNGRLQGGTADA